jgi:hypothetical protein
VIEFYFPVPYPNADIINIRFVHSPPHWTTEAANIVSMLKDINQQLAGEPRLLAMLSLADNSISEVISCVFDSNQHLFN